MKSISLLICSALITLNLFFESILLAQSVVRVDSFYMPSLGRTKKLSVLLPTKYDPAKQYPVLYLLHGYSGGHDDWWTRTKLREYVRDIPLIVVMPDGENSWYVNSVLEPNERFEDYLVKDLRQYIQKLYSIDTTRQAIAGLSMGGYGAMMLGLRHPSKFEFVGSLSGAITFPRGMNDTTRPAERSLFPSLRRAFGEKPNNSRNAHDVFLLYRQTMKDSLPYMYMVIGIQDSYRNFLPAHRAFTDLLRTYGAAYEYHETQGGHTWQFWDREIQPLLRRMREVLKF
ncbi:MAG: alpha/beta hydrolase family protein [Ignavibacteria bacterium]|nr:alpha/beta hydrolase family protein [Ignavibacteria bacterium]